MPQGMLQHRPCDFPVFTFSMFPFDTHLSRQGLTWGCLEGCVGVGRIEKLQPLSSRYIENQDLPIFFVVVIEDFGNLVNLLCPHGGAYTRRTDDPNKQASDPHGLFAVLFCTYSDFTRADRGFVESDSLSKPSF